MVAPNLPLQLTSFIGRANDLLEVVTLLRDPACRLLTLVGPGGMGKTRLAIQAAAQAQRNFEDGVYFAALQPVSSTDFLVPALRDALNLTFYGQESPRSQLLHHLQAKKLLLVMDNFEHLLDDVALLTTILEAAPRVKLLVTSRETLNVREEWVREVSAMQVPDNEQAIDLEDYDAAQLFIERARQARGHFAVDRERPHVIRICQLVEGLPLAIELAAARVRTLSCAQIAEEIQHSMGFLATSLRNVPERHRDMYAMFEPCWNRLAQPQREVFMRLSMFRGGFEREAAEQVAGASPHILAALADKSLLRVTPTGRYEIHELVRQYAEARLAETADEIECVQDRHCTYYAGFLQQREPDLKGANLLRALAEIRPEIDNIRVMWQRAVEHGRWDAIAGCLDSLGFVFQNRAMWREGADAFGIAIAALGDTPSALLGRLLMWRGHAMCGEQHGEEAHQLLKKAVTILHEFGLYHADPISYQHLLCFWAGLSDIEQLERLLLLTLAQFRARGDTWRVANMLVWLGAISEEQCDFEQAEAYTAEGLALYRELGNLWGISSALHGMHGATFGQERYTEAWRFAEECVACCEAIDDPPGVVIGLWRLGKACYALQDYRKAKELFERSIRTATNRLHGLEQRDLFELDFLAAVACRLGDYEQSRAYFRNALIIGLCYWHPRMAARTLSFSARLLAATGRPARAVEVLAATLPLLTNWILERTEAEELLASLQTTLPPDEFAAARACGEADDLEVLAAAILEELESQEETPSLTTDTPRRPGQPLIDPLSERELEVLQLVAEGWSNREIAQELVVTVGTVKKHLNNIFSKLRVRSRTQAVVRAKELDLLS